MIKGGVIRKIHREVKVQVSVPKPKPEGEKNQRTTPQYFIQIPKEIVLELGIEKGDKVIMEVPLEDKSQYSIKFVKKAK